MHRLWSKDEGVLTNIITFNIFNPSMREYDNIEQIWINYRPQTKIEAHRNSPFSSKIPNLPSKTDFFIQNLSFLNQNQDILHKNCYFLFENWIFDEKIEAQKNRPFLTKNSNFLPKTGLFLLKLSFLNENRDILNKNCYFFFENWIFERI